MRSGDAAAPYRAGLERDVSTRVTTLVVVAYDAAGVGDGADGPTAVVDVATVTMVVEVVGCPVGTVGAALLVPARVPATGLWA